MTPHCLEPVRMIYLSLKKTNFFTGKIFKPQKHTAQKVLFEWSHADGICPQSQYQNLRNSRITIQIFISNDMDCEISDRLKYFDNLHHGNNLQVHVNAMMCSKLKELQEVTVHCR